MKKIVSLLADNLAVIKKNMADGLQPSRRITLIAVSKTQTIETVRSAYDLGVRDFGENKLQEAEKKFTAIDFRKDIHLHFIGHLQTNKVKKAVQFFDVIHSLDRPSLADALAKEQSQWQGSKPFPKLLIEVNIGREMQKSGIDPDQLVNFYNYCREKSLPIVGLMAILPLGKPPSPYFASLKKMADQLGLAELSMGMSDDYKEAIDMGATMIRVGTALFGKRQ